MGWLAPALLALALLFAGSSQAAAPVTNAGDAARTGWYPDQPSLHPQVVTGGSFGQLFSTPVDGQVYAQPLVANGTLFVATEQNWIYGMDPRTGAVKWTRNVGPAFDPTAAPVSCGDLAPRVGVTGTPVIDPDTNTAYFFAKTYVTGSSGPAAYDAHAVDVATGAERAGFPVRISGPAQNNPLTGFDATKELQRPGLLLLDGVVYAAFGGHCDSQPFQGWVVGVSTAGETRARWVAVGGENQSGAGIWQSGGGLVSDGPGRILLATGNGYGSDGSPSAPTPGANPPAGLGQSDVRLQVQPGGSLQAADFFAPYDAAELDTWDADLGSGSPVALPDSFGTAAHPHLLVQMTKGGYVYLLDRDHLGGAGMGDNGGDAVVQRTGSYGGVWSRPAVWPGDGGYVYAPTASSTDDPGVAYQGVLRVYRSRLDGAGNPSLSLVASSQDGFTFGSGAPVVTSDGINSGSAIVWLVRTAGGGGTGAELRAYSAVPVAGRPQLLWSAPIGTAAKFTSPGVAGGRLYVGTADGHVVGFGSPAERVLDASSLSFPGVVTGQHADATATLKAARDVTVTGLSTTSGQFTAGTPSRSLPATLAAGDEMTVPVRFAPTSSGPKGGTLAVATSQGQQSVGLSGTGVSADPELMLDPPAVSFGGTRVLGQLTGTATIANVGGAPLTINGVDPPEPPFSVGSVPPAGSVLQPGEAVVVDVHFNPPGVGRYIDELHVRTNAGDESVGLSGTAGDPPKLEIWRPSIDFGALPLGASDRQSFWVYNAGGTALTITKSKPPAGGAFVGSGLAEGTVVPPLQTATGVVEFRPAGAGPVAAQWTLTGDDGYGPQLVSVNGQGLPVQQDARGETPPVASLWPDPAAPAPVLLSRLRVTPSKLAPGAKARAAFRLTGAGTVRFALERRIACRASQRCRRYVAVAGAWSVRAVAGANRLTLPRRYRSRAGRFRLTAAPVGGRAVRTDYAVSGR